MKRAPARIRRCNVRRCDLPNRPGCRPSSHSRIVGALSTPSTSDRSSGSTSSVHTPANGSGLVLCLRLLLFSDGKGPWRQFRTDLSLIPDAAAGLLTLAFHKLLLVKTTCDRSSIGLLAEDIHLLQPASSIVVTGKSYCRVSALEDPAAVPALIRALEDEEPAVRVSASKALGRLRDHRALEPLVNLLDDESSPVRESAGTSLGRLGDAGAARAPGAVEEPSAVTALIRALEDEEQTVRVSAARALGGLRDPRGFEPLVNLLEDEDCHVRAAVAGSLGGLGDVRAVPHLNAALDADEMMVRRAAERSLEQLRDS